MLHRFFTALLVLALLSPAVVAADDRPCDPYGHCEDEERPSDANLFEALTRRFSELFTTERLPELRKELLRR